MPGPFPGMDPYLEAPSQWQGIHNTLIVYFAEQLNRIMPRGYAARAEDRCRIVQTQRNAYPDVVVSRRRPSSPVPLQSSASGGTAVADRPVSVMDAADIPVVLEAIAVEPHETYIDIIALKPDRQVVATIELLSPVNKTPGEGQNLYLAKQEKILNSHIHLIEIDLLRAGLPTVVAARSLLPGTLTYDYLICLHRGGQGERYEVWFNSIRQPLPRIAVPLSPQDPDAVLDLQAAIDRFYDSGRLADDIDYTQPPEPPLTGEDAAWADALLREKGLRS